MRINYNGIEILMVRTAQFDLATKYDESGLDPLYQEATIGGAFVWHPNYTASGKAQNVGLGGLSLQGDRMGPSIARLEQALNTPRAPLQLWMGRDLIFDVPALDAATGLRYPCDPAGGPTPQEVKVENVVGDKTAFGLLRLKFATSACNRYVLSHRWSSTADTDEAGFTTITREGTATVRLDFMEGLPAGGTKHIDAFRGAFAHPVPAGFRRARVRVYVTPAGDSLSYTVEDVEQAINLGNGGVVFKIAGNASAGVEWPIKDIKQLGSTVMGGLGGAVGGLGALFNPLSALGAAPGAVSWLWANLMPRQQCNAICRAYGRAGANRYDLALYATRVVLDRLAPAVSAKLAKIVSFYATSAHDSDGVPFAEVRAEVLGLSPTAIAAIFNPRDNVVKMINMDGTISGPDDAPLPRPAKDDPTYPNPPFPASNGTRGRYVGALVEQILNSADTICAPPGAPGDVYIANPITLDEPRTS